MITPNIEKENPSIEINSNFIAAEKELVKDLLEQEKTDLFVYHIILSNRYTRAKQVKMLSGEDIRERVILLRLIPTDVLQKRRMEMVLDGMQKLEV